MGRRKPKANSSSTMNTNTSEATPTSSQPNNSLVENHLNAINVFIELLRKFPEETSQVLEILSDIETSKNKKGCCEILKLASERVKNMNNNQIEYTKNKISETILPKSLLKFWIFQDEFEKYDIDLGSGGMSIVFLGKITNKTPQKAVAIKIAMLPEYEKVLMEEAEVMAKLQHPNILEIVGFTTDGYVGILTEHMEEGTLKNVLRKNCSLKKLLKYMSEIADGLEYLIDKKFIHRDLCARNIFVNSNNTCKIGDFGFCKYLGDSKYYSDEFQLNNFHVAPEVKINNIYSFASDIFAMAVLMADILYSPDILSDRFYIQLMGKTEFIKQSIPLPSKCPQQLQNIIRGGLSELPDRRPNIKQIKECILKCLA